MTYDVFAPTGNTAKFNTVGDTITGTIIKQESRQARDFATGEPKTWSDGRPVIEGVITLACDNGDNVVLYAGGNKLKAIREAIARAGAPTLELGAKLAIKYSSDGEPPKPGFHAPKLFVAKYEAPANATSDPFAVTGAVQADDIF